MKFKIGDLVEGETDGKWVRGYVVNNRWGGKLLCVEVINQHGNDRNLHTCNGYVPSGKGWELRTELAKLAKSEIVKQIINDL